MIIVQLDLLKFRLVSHILKLERLTLFFLKISSCRHVLIKNDAHVCGLVKISLELSSSRTHTLMTPTQPHGFYASRPALLANPHDALRPDVWSAVFILHASRFSHADWWRLRAKFKFADVNHEVMEIFRFGQVTSKRDELSSRTVLLRCWSMLLLLVDLTWVLFQSDCFRCFMLGNIYQNNSYFLSWQCCGKIYSSRSNERLFRFFCGVLFDFGQ